MQKQGGLYLASVVFFLVALGLIYVAGPDSYPRTTSNGEVVKTIPRTAWIGSQLVTLGGSFVVVAIMLAALGRRPGSRMKPEVRAYWIDRPAEYRHRTWAWILNTAAVGTFTFGLMVLVKSAVPAIPSVPLAVIFLTAIGVTFVRGVLPVTRPPISDDPTDGGASPYGDADSGVRRS